MVSEINAMSLSYIGNPMFRQSISLSLSGEIHLVFWMKI